MLQPKQISPLQKKRLPMFDIPFFVGVIALLCAGLLMLFSAGFASAFSKTGDSYYYIRRQLIYALIGLVFMLGISFIPYKFYRHFVFLFYLASVALLVLVLIFPSNDAEKRWIYIGSFQFQPSEIAKVAVVLLLAHYLSLNKDRMDTFVRGFLIPLGIILLPTILVAVETHLSGAILIFMIGAVMLLCGGCRMRYPLISLAVVIPAAVTLVLTNDYMLRRVKTFLDPSADLLGDGWQITQSLITIGSGGLFGLGYGKSRQKYLYMSEPQNDFIFSVVCEEIGLIGALFIMGLFVFLIWRGIHLAMHAPNTFTSLIIVGIMTRVSVQVLLNLAVVSNSVPVTGISLPFFSYGGTALVVLLCEMGLVLHISRYPSVE